MQVISNTQKTEMKLKGSIKGKSRCFASVSALVLMQTLPVIAQSSTDDVSMAVASQEYAEAAAEKKVKGATDLENIVVIGTDPKRYQTNAGKSLTGLPLHYLELPRIVDVISEQTLLDQKVTELEEALRNVPGVSLSDGFGGSNNDYLIRGFRRSTIYRNGLRVLSNFRVNTANLESVRVIKGPASITYGQVEPGGLVDIETKRPLEELRVFTEARVGSYSNYLFLGDVSLPINEKAAIRINASTQDSDSFRESFAIKRDTLSLTGVYRFTESTILNVSYEYRDEFRSFDRGTVTVPTADGREIVNKIFDIPLERRFGEPFEEIDTKFQFATADLTQNMGENWKIRLSTAWEKSESDDLQARPRSLVILDAGAPIVGGIFTGVATPKMFVDDPSDQVFLVRRTDGSRQRKRTAFYLGGLISGELDTGNIHHRIAMGADYQSASGTRYFTGTGYTDGVPVSMGGNGPLFDLQNPVYGDLPDTLSVEGLSLIETQSVDQGLFLNDYIDLTSKLGLLVGARFDFSDVDGDGPADAAHAFSPQVGLNYRATDNISVFVSYAEAFRPNSTFVVDAGGNSSETEVYPPEDSRQYEAGVKAQLFDDRLKASASIYKIEKQNVLTSVDGMFELVKGQQSKGFEASVSGQPAPGMNIIAGYAYTDAEVLTGSNAGKTPANVADHTFNLWSSYEFYEGKLQGLGLGAGIFHMADRFGDNANSWKLGSYTLVDASVWYTLPVSFASGGNVRIQFSAKNIFNKEYYSASGGDLRVSIGTPRTLFASVAATF